MICSQSSDCAANQISLCGLQVAPILEENPDEVGERGGVEARRARGAGRRFTGRQDFIDRGQIERFGSLGRKHLPELLGQLLELDRAGPGDSRLALDDLLEQPVANGRFAEAVGDEGRMEALERIVSLVIGPLVEQQGFFGLVGQQVKVTDVAVLGAGE